MTQLQLTVHQDGSWFRVDDQQSVDLRSRSRYRVLLQMLVREHLRDPSATISVAAVIREVWPDERLRHTVARNRAYVAMCSLRKWGLEGLVLRTQQGYQLDPNLTVKLVDVPAEDARSPHETAALRRNTLHAEAEQSSECVREEESKWREAARNEVTPSEATRAEHTVSDARERAADRPLAEDRTLHEQRAPADQRESHSMRVRLVDMPESGEPRRAMARLVG